MEDPIEQDPNLCPYCQKAEASDKHFKESRDCAEALSDDMFESLVPSDVRREFYENTHKHRVLPSGDVEFADEYGGY